MVWPQAACPNGRSEKKKHFACLIHEDEQRALCLMFNAGADAVDFLFAPPENPAFNGKIWPVITLDETPCDLFPLRPRNALNPPLPL